MNSSLARSLLCVASIGLWLAVLYGVLSHPILAVVLVASMVAACLLAGVVRSIIAHEAARDGW